MEILKQIKQLGDVSKFSWKEMVNDNTGKTSAPSIGGLVLVVAGAGIGIYATICKVHDIVQLATDFAMYGAGLLGLHGVMNRGTESVSSTPKQEEASTEQ